MQHSDCFAAWTSLMPVRSQELMDLSETPAGMLRASAIITGMLGKEGTKGTSGVAKALMGDMEAATAQSDIFKKVLSPPHTHTHPPASSNIEAVAASMFESDIEAANGTVSTKLTTRGVLPAVVCAVEAPRQVEGRVQSAVVRGRELQEAEGTPAVEARPDIGGEPNHEAVRARHRGAIGHHVKKAARAAHRGILMFQCVPTTCRAGHDYVFTLEVTGEDGADMILSAPDMDVKVAWVNMLERHSAAEEYIDNEDVSHYPELPTPKFFEGEFTPAPLLASTALKTGYLWKQGKAGSKNFKKR